MSTHITAGEFAGVLSEHCEIESNHSEEGRVFYNQVLSEHCEIERYKK